MIPVGWEVILLVGVGSTFGSRLQCLDDKGRQLQNLGGRQQRIGFFLRSQPRFIQPESAQHHGTIDAVPRQHATVAPLLVELVKLRAIVAWLRVENPVFAHARRFVLQIFRLVAAYLIASYQQMVVGSNGLCKIEIDLHAHAVFDAAVQPLHGQRVGGLCGIIKQNAKNSSVAMRIIIDTNVIFEGLTQRGSASGLIVLAGLAGRHDVCVSNALMYEYESVLSRELAPQRWRTLQPAR